MSESLKEKTAKGLFWGGFSNGIQQLLNLFFGIFLARLLNAESFTSKPRLRQKECLPFL